MSCDSVRRNFASIPEDKALPWAWREGRPSALPRTRRPREHLRRDEEPVGMERLHGALAEADGPLRGNGRDRGEPLERVHEAWRRRDAPRGRHLPSAPPVVRREAVSPCAAGNRHHLHRHVRKGPWDLPRHQRFPVQHLGCVAVERRRTSPAHSRARIPQIRHDSAVVSPRHRRPDDNAARLNRQSNGIIATSARQL